MAFSRSYKPKYPRTNKQHLELIKEKISKSYHNLYIHENDQPYDLYHGKKVKTHHLVMWYDNSTDIYWWMHYKNQYQEDGYFYWEASNKEKSIKHPHVHFVKIL